MGFCMFGDSESVTYQPLLSEPQFTTNDVEKITSLSGKALEHMLDPQKGRVRLIGAHVNPGRGKRRMFTGEDILAIETARVMSEIGFPQRWSHILTDQVSSRASQMVSGHLVNPQPLAFALWPGEGDDWAFTAIRGEDGPTGPIPVAFQLLDVDRLITETVAKLEAIVAGADVPSFKVEPPKPEPSPYSPENDFFAMWEKDEEGRLIRTGLTFEETRELIEYEEDFENRHDRSFEDRDRIGELTRKHETARLARVAREAPERLAEAVEKAAKK
ncbi:MAG TPA: hypothetical protein VMM55_14360 [Thermohalobaculum sp.]|nr:hypothetical protein [Thermohalobaculum sp.]